MKTSKTPTGIYIGKLLESSDSGRERMNNKKSKWWHSEIIRKSKETKRWHKVHQRYKEKERVENKKTQNDERNSCKARRRRSKGNSKTGRWRWKIQRWLKKDVLSCQTATKIQREKDNSRWRRRSNNWHDKSDQDHYRILQLYVSQKRRKEIQGITPTKMRIPFTAEEIKTSINKLKNGKSPGIDNLNVH